MRRAVVWTLLLPAISYAALAASGSADVRDTAAAEVPGLRLHRALPKDPLAVVAMSVEDPSSAVGELFDQVSRWIGAASGPSLLDRLAQWDERVGFSIERELLDQLGPEITLAVDLPPVDFALITLQSGEAGSFSTVLGEIGLLAEVRDADRLDRALWAVLELLPGEPRRDEDGFVSAEVPIWVREGDESEADSLRSHVTLSYAIRDGRVAVGMSREWVEAAFRVDSPDSKLAAGADFARVFADLDPQASRLTYVNLPKIRERVVRSHVLSAVLEDNPRTQELLRVFTSPEVMRVGLGSTAVAMNDGVRTTNFGPDWLAGPVMSGGLLAALVMPALLSNEGDAAGPGQQTVEDIRTIGVACEGFSEHTQTYPPTDGWVPVDRIAFYLEPLYVGVVPRTDDWNNPILYWSDGASYRILSTGPDGRMDLDWSSVAEPDGAAGVGDIVFGDGRFLAKPE